VTPFADLPPWVAEAAAVLNPAGRSVWAALRGCPRCGSAVWSGPDVREAGCADLTVDPAILDPAAELSVLLAGRGTVEVEARPRRGIMLFHRDRWLMAKPAGTRGRFAAPEHECFAAPVGIPVPWGMIYELPNHHERSQNDNECPF
jgi:ribosomal protein S27AE